MEILCTNKENIAVYKITFAAELRAFTLLEDFLVELSNEFQFPSKILKQLLVVVDEVFTNIVVHGYICNKEEVPNSEHAEIKNGKECIILHFSFDITKKILVLKFIDTARAYNPLEVKEPDIYADLEGRAVGGLGIFLVKKLMDSVEYMREDGRNILILQKKI